MNRAKLTWILLWLSVFFWGIALGAKIFDLVVLAGAWGASPPSSLALMPYGRRFPIDPGDFFQPLSVLILVLILGALIAGWKTPSYYRRWLWLAVLAFVIVWILTPTIFWPMIDRLWSVGTGKLPMSDADTLRLVHRWILWDWFRVALIAAGFLGSIRAISMPYPARQDSI